jgi:hypothetical protein
LGASIAPPPLIPLPFRTAIHAMLRSDSIPIAGAFLCRCAQQGPTHHASPRINHARRTAR